MDKKIKTKWLKALRSGKYKQAIGALKAKNKYCCLGVLCELSKLDDWRQVEELQNQFFYGRAKTKVLPVKVKNWAKLPERNPFVIYKDDRRDLASLNDCGLSFSQIADLVEAQL